MFCDVTVSVPDRDVDGKLGMRGSDGCHLGYDARRRAHFVFVPSLRRLGSFTVTEWREHSFTICKLVTADTPVEYHESFDLPMPAATASQLPRRHRVGRDTPVAATAARGAVLILFAGPERDSNISTYLRGKSVNVSSYDLLDGSDLRQGALRERILQSIGDYSFVFMSPPCTTACIAFEPPLRTATCPRGVPGLAGRQKLMVDAHNVLFDFCASVAVECDAMNVPWVMESAASRRSGPAEWQKYAQNGFFWDYPPVAKLSPPAEYLAFAQCAFGAKWQKYTGLLSSATAARFTAKYFQHATCVCKSHDVQLRGYDPESGRARTAQAGEYPALLSKAFGELILDASGIPPISEGGSTAAAAWEAKLNELDHDGLCQLASNETPEAVDLPSRTWLAKLHADELTNQTPSTREYDETLLEFWSDDSEGAYRVSSIGSIPVPKDLAEAMASTHWLLFKAAMEEEISGKMANDSWDVVERPRNAHVMKGRWVFDIKWNDDGSISKVKARFVAKGFTQIAQTDYDRVFAATLPGISFRVLMACIAGEDLETDQLDAVKAFTQADIDRELYCEMAPGFGVLNMVLRLKKALEGIKQGAFLWFKHNRSAWLKLGFVSWMNEPNLYIHPELRIRVGVFADDMIAGYHRDVKAKYLLIRAEYGKMIKVDSTALTPALKFTGVQISRDRAERTLTLRQERYIEQLATEYDGQFKPQETPHGETKEARQAFDNMQPATPELSIDRGKYLQLMGKLIWPSSMTRPDIAFEVNSLCALVTSPGKEHYEAGLVVIGYLVRTKHLGITYGGKLRIPYGLSEFPPGFEQSRGFYTTSDSSWGTRARPMGGHAIMLNNGPVGWCAKTLKIVPDSTCEAETAVGSRAVKDTIFVRMLLINNMCKIVGPTPHLMDNKAMYDHIQQEGASVRTRYYERATQLIKRAVLLFLVRPYLVKTEAMLADIFTKSTDKGTYAKMRNAMMNVHGVLAGKLEKASAAVHGSSARMLAQMVYQLYPK